MTSPVLVVAAAILDDLDDPRELLAARRAVPARLAGRWEFPGGKVDGDGAGQPSRTERLASLSTMRTSPSSHGTSRH
jgi:8-oxo-dGTP pyrophosphatase MutT (NUDIX family)